MIKFLLVIGMASIYYSLATIDRIWEIKNRKNLNKRAFFVVLHTFRLKYIKNLLNAKNVNERRDILEELVMMKYNKMSTKSQIIYKKNSSNILPTKIDVLLIPAACFIAFTSTSTLTMTQKIVATELECVEEYTDIREIVFDRGKCAS